MKSLILSLFLFFVINVSYLKAERKIAWEEPFRKEYSLENFFSMDWQNFRKTGDLNISKIYKTKKEGDNFYLEGYFDSKNIKKAIHFGKFFKEQKHQLHNYPIISWRWKILKPFPNTKPEEPTQDLPASVYVVIKKTFYNYIYGFKFMWTTHKLSKGFYKQDKMGIVKYILRNSEDPAETWVQESVNLCELYEKIYKKKCEEVSIQYFGVLSDGDETKSVAHSAFDDFLWTSN